MAFIGIKFQNVMASENASISVGKTVDLAPKDRYQFSQTTMGQYCLGKTKP